MSSPQGVHQFPSTAVLAGGGEMGALMRSIDWTATPLGPVDRWPQSLRTTLSILLTSQAPIFLWWGPELVQFYNDAYRPILGAEKHPRAMGQRGRETWAEIWDIIWPMIEHVFAGGSTAVEDGLLVLNRNGYLEEGYFNYAYSPIRGEGGAVEGVFCVCGETTAKVVGERRLRTLKDLAGRASRAESVEEACRVAAETLGANPHDIPFAALYLYSADRRTARLAGSCGLPVDSPVCPATVRLTESVRLEGESWPYTGLAGAPHAERVDLTPLAAALPTPVWPEPPVEAQFLPITLTGEEQPVGFALLGASTRRRLDGDYRSFFSLVVSHIAGAIAEAQAWEDERRRTTALAELDRAKTQFFSNVSHEFRTPLTLLLGPLEGILAREAALPPETRGELDMARRNALRLLKLVNSLLDVARLESGRLQATFEPVDLAALTIDLAAGFRSALERAGLFLTLDCPPLAEPVWVDRELWEKVVLNLLSNAYKFTFTGGVTVRLRQEDGCAVLSVADTGTGIPQQELPRLFERFHRVEGAHGRTHEGSGIGLALVRELAGLHGGAVRVDSSEGEGSTFTVSVPLGYGHLPADRLGAGRRETAAGLSTGALVGGALVGEALHWTAQDAAPVFMAPEGTAAPAPGARVLVVDDNADLREYTRRLLGPHYAVTTAADGAEALRLVAAERPDLVLSDVMMPVLDGYGLLRALRADPATRTLPVILLSARAGEESRSMGMDAGADDYLGKPFSARELLARVGAHLRLAEARRTAEQQATRILESTADSVFLLDRDWRVTFVNRRAVAMIAGGRELVGQVLWEAFPEAIGSTFWHQYHRAAREGVPVEFEEFYSPLGCWFAVRAYPGNDGLSVFFQDITARKEAEHELATLAERNKVAQAAAKAFVYEFRPGTDYVYRNPSVREVTGYAPEEFAATKGGWRVHILPEDTGHFDQVVAAAMREAADFSLEYRVRHKDGRVLWVNDSARTFRDADGRPERVVGLVVDITARMEAEEARRASEARFRSVFENAAVGMARVAFAGERWLEVNDAFCRMLGYPREEMLARSWTALTHPDDLALALAPFRRLAAGELDSCTVEQRFLHRAGHAVWARLTLSLVRDAQGRPDYGICVVEDISERKAAEQAQRAAAARDAYLLDLEERLRTAPTSRGAVTAACEALGRHLGAVLCAVAEIQPDGEHVVMESEWRAGATASVLGRHRLDAYGAGRVPDLLAGRPVPLADVRTDPRTAGTAAEAAYAAVGVHCSLNVPLVREGRVRALLALGKAEPHVWTEEEISLAAATAERLWDAAERARAEEALRLSDDRFRLALEAGGLGVWEFDFATRQIWFDEPAAALYGLGAVASAEAVMARVHPDDLLAVQDAMRRAAGTSRAQLDPVEYRYLTPQGDLRWLTVGGRLRFDGADGTRPARLAGVVQDITARKRAEQAAQAAQERLQAALAASRTGTFRWNLLTNELNWDDALDRLFGLVPGESVRNLGAFVDRVHPDDRAGVIERCERCRTEGADFEMEFRVVRPDGTERWLYDRGQVFRDGAGRPVSMTGACVDITGLRQAQEELRATAERLRLTTAGAGVGTWELDLIEDQGYWSAEADALLGAQDLAFNGENWTARIHPEDRPAASAAWQRAVAEDVPYEAVFRPAVRAADGGERWLLSRGWVQRDAGGRPVRGLGVLLDITERTRAEQELRASEAWLNAVLDALPVGVILADAAGRIVRDNVANRTLWGVPPDTTDWTGYSDWAGWWPDTGQRIQAHEWGMARALLQGEVIRGELVEYQPFGSTARRFILNNAAPVRDAAGRILGGVVAQQDVTAQRRADTALRESENRFRSLAETIREVFYVHELDEGRISYVSPAYERVWGRPVAELYANLTSFVEAVHPDDRHLVFAAIERQRQGHDTVTDYRLVLADGTVRQIHDRAFVTAGLERGTRRVVGVAEDATLRHQAAEALRASERRYRQIVETAAEGIWMSDAAGRTTLVNPRMCRLLGYREEELIGLPLQALVFDEDEARSLAKFARRTSGERGTCEFRLKRRDGREVWTLLSVSPVEDAGGQFAGVLGMFTDITARKRADQALRESKERYRLVLRATNDAIWDWNLQTDQIEWNPAIRDRFGYELADIDPAGTWWQDHIHPDDRARVVESLHAALAGTGEHWAEEYRFRRADGSYAEVLDRGHLVRDREGRAARMIGSMLDLTEQKRSAAALRASEERFRAAVSAVSSIIWTNNPEGKMEGEQPGWSLFTGQRYEEYQGYGWAQAVHPDDARPTIEAWNQAVAERRRFVFEHRLRRHDGAWRLCSLRAVPVRHEDGSVREWVGVHTDITEERQLMMAVRESEERFRTLFEASPVANYLIDPETNAVVDGNGLAAAQLGCGRDDLLALQVQDFEAQLTPQQVRVNNASLLRGDHLQFESVHRTREGELRDVLVRAQLVEVSGRPLIYASALDVTERRRAEEAFRASEQRLALAVKAASIGIFDWHIPTGDLVWTEQEERLFGLEPGTFGGRIEHWADFTLPEDGAATLAAIQQALAAKQPTLDYEFRIRRANDGAIRWIEGTGGFLYAEDGTPLRMIGVNLDTTERRVALAKLEQANRTLQRSNEDLQQFAWAASHDLQEPMRMVALYTQRLERHLAGQLDGTGREFLGYAQEGARRMQSLITGLRHYWEASEADQEPPQRVDTGQVLADALGNLHVAIQQQRGVVTHGPLPVVRTYQTRLLQVFQNLIGNALKFHRPGQVPRVHISAERQSGSWVFAVSDDGIGIDPRHREHIFGVFKRLDRKGPEGAGMGLALVKQAIERIGGHIWIEGEPDRGTTFRFTVPDTGVEG